MDRRDRRSGGRQHRLRSHRDGRCHLSSDGGPQLHASAFGDPLNDRPRSQARGNHAGHAESHVPREQRRRGQRDGDQGRQGLPPAQRRAGPLQDHQQVRLLSRGLGPRPVVRLDSRPSHDRLRTGVPGDAVCAAAERVPLRYGRPHTVGVRGAMREGHRGAHQVPPAKYGRGADRGTGDERRGGAWPRLLADAPRDMQRVRCRADRRRGDDGSGQDGQDVRGRPLGRRAGYHDDGGRTERRIHADWRGHGHHRDCRPLRGHGLLLPARLHLRGASGRGRRSAQEHRDHRVGGAGGERRRVRRVPHGVALDSHGRPSHRRRRSRAGTAVRHRAGERP